MTDVHDPVPGSMAARSAGCVCPDDQPAAGMTTGMECWHHFSTACLVHFNPDVELAVLTKKRGDFQ